MVWLTAGYPGLCMKFYYGMVQRKLVEIGNEPVPADPDHSTKDTASRFMDRLMNAAPYTGLHGEHGPRAAAHEQNAHATCTLTHTGVRYRPVQRRYRHRYTRVVHVHGMRACVACSPRVLTRARAARPPLCT